MGSWDGLMVEWGSGSLVLYGSLDYGEGVWPSWSHWKLKWRTCFSWKQNTPTETMKNPIITPLGMTQAGNQSWIVNSEPRSILIGSLPACVAEKDWLEGVLCCWNVQNSVLYPGVLTMIVDHNYSKLSNPFEIYRNPALRPAHATNLFNL